MKNHIVKYSHHFHASPLPLFTTSTLHHFHASPLPLFTTSMTNVISKLIKDFDNIYYEVAKIIYEDIENHALISELTRNRSLEEIIVLYYICIIFAFNETRGETRSYTNNPDIYVKMAFNIPFNVAVEKEGKKDKFVFVVLQKRISTVVQYQLFYDNKTDEQIRQNLEYMKPITDLCPMLIPSLSAI